MNVLRFNYSVAIAIMAKHLIGGSRSKSEHCALVTASLLHHLLTVMNK